MLVLAVMLQRNAARRAHLTHVAVAALHTFCCGLPALAVLAAAISGANAARAGGFELLHGFLHERELWVLGLSMLLLGAGGVLELIDRRRHAHGFPWLFVLSAGCVLVNAGLIAAHRWW